LKRKACFSLNFTCNKPFIFHENCFPKMSSGRVSLNYRDRLDIIADILQVAEHNAKKTQILYQANLSYNVLQRYLSEVAAASLVSFESDSQSFMLTAKGKEFLQGYKKYSKNSARVEKRLSEVAAKRKVLEQLCLPSQLTT
jgi:predicted transcriptional regulator